MPIGRWIEALIAWTRHEGVLGLAGFALVFIVLTLTMLPTLELYIGAGLIYGTWWGAALTTVLSLVAALLAYMIARTSLRRWIERRLAHHRRIRELDKGIGDHAFWVATLVRLAPVLPFGPTNYVLGASRISPAMYALTVVVGTVPTNLMYAYAGSLLHRVSQLSSAHEGHPLLVWGGLAATLAATLLLGWIAKRALDRAANHC
ncbi:MAG: TVP38/TMEM64 family protein [Deltaproteobacteria bacterium]|nr:TVP38/TMEM64 family protein [Deltaproteobacteria bacterium]